MAEVRRLVEHVDACRVGIWLLGRILGAVCQLNVQTKVLILKPGGYHGNRHHPRSLRRHLRAGGGYDFMVPV